MIHRCLIVAAMTGALAGIMLAGEKAKDAKPNKPDKAASKAPKAPSLEELRTIVQPMLETLDLAAQQKDRANEVMSKEGWEAALKVFDKKRGGEILSLAHKKVPEIMPAIMMPRMMAYNMEKMMDERMARKAGPPTPKEIEAIRTATRKRMSARLAPAIMGRVEELAARRMEEVRLDKKILVRALAEGISEAALTDKQAAKLDKMLSEAGYPKELIHGPDPVLMKRVNKMLETVADEVIAELKKADSSGKKTGESKE
jgi:uncharacterized protein YihD (DUF1040 family)